MTERPLHSALYVGRVGHCRTAHARNAFSYSLFFVYLDLAELERVFTGRWLWSVERANWATFRRRDHLRQPGPLDEAVRGEVARQLGFRPAGPVRILTHLRYLGCCFNPISLYYCFAADGRTLEAILAEVHNTPWGEEYLRAVDTRGAPDDLGWHACRLEKEFHVSPFMPMDIGYEWRFTAPGERLRARIESRRRGEPIFSAWFDLERRVLDGRALALALWRWPCMTAKVVAAIYWQALRLKCKGVPFCPHPERLEIERGTYHP
ncbi:MAG: DUF1365 domain-containing protein [Deltaproteobacteria bacterium]|nr:MAG: DUF1365 domain-containing protein [Deltaproteobacteria bacterium]